MMMRPKAPFQALSLLYSFPGTATRPHNFTFQLYADDTYIYISNPDIFPNFILFRTPVHTISF